MSKEQCVACRSKTHSTADCPKRCSHCHRPAYRRCLLCGEFLCMVGSEDHQCAAKWPPPGSVAAQPVAR
jgi:hypothetical protein